MLQSEVKNAYEARVKIGHHILSKITGENANALKVRLIQQCDLESSGARGELIDLATGKIIYRCHKQTLVDK
ncbi:hypothetical protein ACTAZI_18345 [Legionella bozemanae]|uniref:hypothetical protein n=1 Tax=Legionella bozemanae TaxID=447 RepID=UPI003EEACA41